MYFMPVFQFKFPFTRIFKFKIPSPLEKHTYCYVVKLILQIQLLCCDKWDKICNP